MPKHGVRCPCVNYYDNFAAKGMYWDPDANRYVKFERSRGGTFNSTAFKVKTQRDDPNILNIYFNGPGDGSRHGHVQKRRNPDGTVSYPFVRDVEGDIYDTN